jgi:hypothetical protein
MCLEAYEHYRIIRFCMRDDDVPLLFARKTGQGMASCVRYSVFRGVYLCCAYRLDSICDCRGFVGRRCVEEVGGEYLKAVANYRASPAAQIFTISLHNPFDR